MTTSAVAVLAAGLTTSAFLLVGSREQAPTLMATRSLALRDRIVVADFEDRTGDAGLAAAITDAVRTDLSQSPVIRVMTPRQVRSSLDMMQQSADVALNDSLARELALREGVKAIVTGSLARLSDGYTISLQLVAAQTGESLAAVRETARDATRLITAVDRASRSLRQRIGESLRDLEATPSLAQATTASLEALRLFSEAERLVRQGERTAAVEHLTRAVALDSGFATAHLSLAMAYGSMGDNGRAEDAGDRAMANQDRLPFLERSFLIASRAYSREDHETAIRVYTDVVRRYPDNVAALNNLALAYRDSRRYAVAESLFLQASEIDSTIANFLYGVHSTQVLQGRFDEATITLRTLERRFPDHPVYLTELLQDAAAQQDWARTEQTAWTQIEKSGSDTVQLVDPYEALAQVAMARGRLHESERLWAVHSRVARASGMMSRHLFGVLQRAYLELRYRNDTVRAVALVDAALRDTPLDTLLRGDRRYDEVARFYIAAGQPGRAGPLIAAAEANDSAMRRTLHGERAWTRGRLALSEGRVQAAIEELRGASERLTCPSCALPDLGRAYERAGRLTDAADTYQKYLTTPWLWRYETDAIELGWTLDRLARLSEQLGDTSRARAARGQLIQLWSSADAPLRASLLAHRTSVRHRDRP